MIEPFLQVVIEAKMRFDVVDQFLVAVVDDVMRGHKLFPIYEKAGKSQIFHLDFCMNLEIIKAKTLVNQFFLSDHADHGLPMKTSTLRKFATLF